MPDTERFAKSAGGGTLLTMRPPYLPRLLRCAIVAGILLASHARAQAPKSSKAALTATDILHAIREAQGTRHDALEGQLRDDIAGTTFPFRLVSDGPQVRYEFKGPPPTAVQVRYNEDGSELVESGPEGSGKLTAATFDKHILGTDLTYEDLALRFVYWPNAVIEGDDSIATRPGLEATADRAEPPHAIR